MAQLVRNKDLVVFMKGDPSAPMASPKDSLSVLSNVSVLFPFSVASVDW